MIVIKSAPVPDDPILLAAMRMEPTMRDAFLRAVAAATSRVSLAEIQRAIYAGDSGRIISLLDGKLTDALQGAGLPADATSLREAIQQTFATGAHAAVEQMPARAGIELRFNVFAPDAVQFLEQYNFGLIQQISADTRQAIQQRVIRAFQEGGSPIEQARDIRNVIGLTARQEIAISNFRSALEGGTTTDLREALSRSLRDGRFDRSLLRAMNDGQGLSAAKIDAMVDRYRQRYIKYRAETIARTETLRAANAGQLETWRQAEQQGLLTDPKRKWIVSGDERTCPTCNGLAGEIRGLSEMFSAGVMGPPAHPDCRCTTALVTKWATGRLAA